jgi:geranylgeranyl reductase family protein
VGELLEAGGGGVVGGPVDVAVVGAGPAGAAAALAVLRAAPGARVVLLDRASFPRDKACGDGVAPHVQDVLTRLGVPPLLEDHAPGEVLRLEFPGGASAARPMPRPARVVPRTVLDARLVAAAQERGAQLVRHRVRRLERDGDLEVLDGDLRARVVVGADGPRSAVQGALAARLDGRGLPGVYRPRLPRPVRGGDVAVALRGYAPVGAGREREQIIAFEPDAAWPAYAWSFPVGDGRANVGYGELLPADGRPGPTKARMLERLEALLPGAGDGGTAWRAAHLPLSPGRARQPDGAVLLAGDALGLVNPLTGEGIHAAVLSGALAGLAAARALRRGRPHDAGRSYRLALRSTFGRHHVHLGAVARLAADRRLVAAGLRAGGDRQDVFDGLVEMGLADGTLTRAVLGGTMVRLRPGLGGV